MGGPKTNYMTLGPKLYLFSVFSPRICFCLLYTSDAADEGLGVDLGGRRIIKKANMGRKVALRGQKFVKKVNMGRNVDLGRKI